MTDEHAEILEETAAERRKRLVKSAAARLNARASHTGRTNPQTREVPAHRMAEHASHAWAALRLIVETWAVCQSPVPQPLAMAVIEGKKALNRTLERE
jgi:hypothetical protein